MKTFIWTILCLQELHVIGEINEHYAEYSEDGPSIV
jgi:hypothetical protein